MSYFTFTMMTYKDNYYFTGQCLSLDEQPGNRATIVAQLSGGAIDWEACLQLWSDHLVIPAIYLRFRSNGLLERLPWEMVEILEGSYQENLRRNESILAQVQRVSAVLLTESIFPVFLKGTAQLLNGLYSDLGERIVHDIDVLVGAEDFLRAGVLLEAAGYRHDEPPGLNFRRMKHYPALYKEEEPAVVQVHRIPVEAAYGSEFTAQVVFRDKRRVKDLPGVFVPCNRHLLIHAFIHNQLSYKGHVCHRSSFRSFNDLLQLSKQMQVFTLPSYTRYRRKAICWLVWGQRAMGLENRFYPYESRAGRWFTLQYELALTYTTWFEVYLFIYQVVDLLLVRIGGGLIKALYRQAHRRKVVRILKDPTGYGAQFRSWRQAY